MCYKTPISGAYLVCLMSMVVCAYLSWKQVNLMNNIVSERDELVVFVVGGGGVNYAYDVKQDSCHTLTWWE